MMYIYYSDLNKLLPDKTFRKHLDSMPIHIQADTLRYIQCHDRHTRLYGKLLLKKGLKELGFSDEVLSGMVYSPFSRPYLKEIHHIDFNISHSNNLVVCAISNDNTRLGIDTQFIQQIDFNDFRFVMNDHQWEIIHQSQSPQSTFFKFWTIKESVIKADGRGMSIPLKDIPTCQTTVTLDNEKWHLKEICLNNKYSTYLASNKPVHEIYMQKCEFN